MKEYEYIVLATNEYLSHLVAATICMENYHSGENFSKFFMKLFYMFDELRKDFSKRYANSEDEELLIAKAKTEFRISRENALKDLINDLNDINDSIDYKEEIKAYMELIEKEDVETLEMQIMLYPHLISLIRNTEEREQN